MDTTDNRTDDATMLLALLSHIPEAKELATVTTNGPYGTRLRHAAIAERRAAAISPASKRPILEREFTGQSGSQ